MLRWACERAGYDVAPAWFRREMHPRRAIQGTRVEMQLIPAGYRIPGSKRAT